MKWLTRFANRPEWKWLYVGIGIKRWLVLLLIGVTILSFGFANVLIQVFYEIPLSGIFYYLTLQFIDRILRGILFGAAGLGLIAVSIYKLYQSLLSAFIAENVDIADTLYRKRMRRKGPKIVALGGGTGLSTLLRGLKNHTENLTAIVTVADDGGSSGKLRRSLGVLPPGDFRQCIAALADSEPLVAQLFQYRFGEGDGLEGHSFGNLFIVAMAGITGSFERAILESSRVLAVRGQVVPSTLRNVTLYADVLDPGLARVAGESAITHHGKPIERVYLEPEHVPAYPAAVRAILEADLIIAGPGSLYTSVLPNLLVEEIKHAIEVSTAPKVYVCNIATQPGETDNFTVEDHYNALIQHIGENIFKHVLANNRLDITFPETSKSIVVKLGEDGNRNFTLISADLVDEAYTWRHDPEKLAQTILKWYETSRQVNT
jgi:uncharacterized cofD-like protein